LVLGEDLMRFEINDDGVKVFDARKTQVSVDRR
jgi:hypothetical protein